MRAASHSPRELLNPAQAFLRNQRDDKTVPLDNPEMMQCVRPGSTLARDISWEEGQKSQSSHIRHSWTFLHGAVYSVQNV